MMEAENISISFKKKDFQKTLKAGMTKEKYKEIYFLKVSIEQNTKIKTTMLPALGSYSVKSSNEIKE